MTNVALVTDTESLPIDYDMPLLVDAARHAGLPVEVCNWDDPTVDWSKFDSVLLRSPWTYTSRLPEFLTFCERVSKLTRLCNPLDVVRWGLDKHYLGDLAAQGVPTVPTRFVELDSRDPCSELERFLEEQSAVREIVVKPTVGAYSKDVKRFRRDQKDAAHSYLLRLITSGAAVMLQPYFDSIDALGESDLIYFNGSYSHAIRKGSLLMADGTVNVPTADFRKARVPSVEETAVAEAALRATAIHLGHEAPLLYARIDLIQSPEGDPVLLEMEISEPSLNLPFCEGSAQRMVKALVADLETAKIMDSAVGSHA